MLLTDFRVLSFDCYGTLIDWEHGLWQALQPLLQRGTSSISMTRDEALRPLPSTRANNNGLPPRCPIASF